MDFLLWMMLILPWLTLFFINKHALKRFMPVAIMTALLVTIIFEMSHAFDWWDVEKTIFPWGYITSVPLVYGVFLVGHIWIMRISYDRGFGIYILTNLIADAFHAFIGTNILIWFGIYELKNMGNFGAFLLMVLLALIAYSYQRWQETIIKKKINSQLPELGSGIFFCF